MKIKINAIGFGDMKSIQTGESIAKAGLVAAAIGIIAVAVGSIIANRTSWVAGNTENHIEYIQEIFKEFDAGCNG